MEPIDERRGKSRRLQGELTGLRGELRAESSASEPTESDEKGLSTQVGERSTKLCSSGVSMS